MKLDLFKKGWLDVVFEGKNKSYGAYDLRKKSPKMAMMALLFGAALFSLSIAAPGIWGSIFDGLSKLAEDNTQTVRTVNLPPPPPPPVAPPPPPPPPQAPQVKFTKPEVAKKEEVTEEPPKVEELKDKKISDKTVEGDINAPEEIPKPDEGTGEDINLYNSAGVEVSPEFPGGPAKWQSYLKNNFKQIEDEDFKGGRVMVSFVVEKDGSLTDIKVLRDVGYGTKEEAIRLFNRSPKWTPAIQNGNKVRCSYVQPITLAAASSE
jgi:periplasmic protein TonB